MKKKIIVVGGVAGGASCACRLRRLDENADITIIEKGEHISFASCGLPYYIGGVITDRAELIVQTPELMHSRFNLHIKTLCEAAAIDRNKKTVTVKNLSSGREEVLPYDTLVLSPGAFPYVPEGICGDGCDRIFTLRNITDTCRIYDFIENQKPVSAVVVGGGFIGIEMAENLKRRGLIVELVELSSHAAGNIDGDMAHIVQLHMKEKGVLLHLGVSVDKIEKSAKGLDIILSDGSTLSSDMVIMSIGIRPDTALAASAGLKLGAAGGIWTDKHMRTSDPDIYAVGDAVEVENFVTGSAALIPLAGPANKQGRIAANNIAGIDDEYSSSQGTSALKAFELTVAATGANEAALEKSNIRYYKIHTHSGSHAGYYPGGSMLSLKLIFGEDGKILGAQAVGRDGADKRIDVISTAMRCGIKAPDLSRLELAYAPPFSSAKDPVNMLGYIAENMLAGLTHMFYAEDVDAPDTESSVLIDVRTEREFAAGCIPGAVNIPLDSLRERLSEVPADKTLYIYCRSGLRGYLAERMLRLNGFENDMYNLSGGYLSYLFMKKDR